MRKLRSKEVKPADYVRHVTVPGVVEYHKGFGSQARLYAYLCILAAVLLLGALAAVVIFNIDSHLHENYVLLGLVAATLAGVYMLFRYQKILQSGIAPNIVSIDTNKQILTVGTDDDQLLFKFDEIQEILVHSKKFRSRVSSALPTRFSYCIVLWTTDDIYLPLMEPLWEIDAPVRVEHEQIARDIAQEMRDLIRQTMIINKSRRPLPAKKGHVAKHH
jgi:hypothetical protein